jgi:uncharacterized protein (UPF0333 family)
VARITVTWRLYELGSEPQTISNKLSLEFILLFWVLLVCISTIFVLFSEYNLKNKLGELYVKTRK